MTKRKRKTGLTTFWLSLMNKKITFPKKLVYNLAIALFLMMALVAATTIITDTSMIGMTDVNATRFYSDGTLFSIDSFARHTFVN